MSASPADRTRRFLSRVAPGINDSAFSGQHVELVAGGWTPATEAAIALAATLLLRLDELAPVIHVRAPQGRTRRLPRLGDGPLVDMLTAEHEGFESARRLTDAPVDDPLVRVAFSNRRDDAINFSVDGWRVVVNGETSGVGNPFAAAYAGALGGNEVFQALLASCGVRVQPFRGSISLWDLRLDGEHGPPPPDVLDLERVAFAACGGVASAIGWTLSLHSLTGRPVVVDPDYIDEDGTNLNRHLTASLSNLGDPKADLLAALLQSAGADAVPVIAPWSTTVADQPEVVVATPDDDAVRRQVQLDLPRVLLSGGTGDNGVYQVARHDFLTGACAGCISRADLLDATPIASAARRLGLTEAELAPYICSERPLPTELLDRTSLNADNRATLIEVPGTDVLEAICATIRIAPVGPAVSAPTLAAIPGVLVASELAKELMNAPTPLRTGENTLMTSIMSRPHERWVRTRRKRDGCECGDAIYIAHYRHKWLVA